MALYQPISVKSETRHNTLTFGQGRSDGGYIGIYTPSPQILQIFMWLLVVFFSLTQDKLLLILKLE